MLDRILATHFAAYPRMEPSDAVKLLFQNEFGPGHMIADQEKCLTRLRQEMAGLAPSAKEALYEPIGNGLCRVNLRACMARGIPAEEINRLFCDTGRAMRGEIKQFEKKLRFLSEFSALEAPFSAVDLDEYLLLYRVQGYPAVSHSPAYRAAYHPAYRVIILKWVKEMARRPRS